jgi:hypothetical protein
MVFVRCLFEQIRYMYIRGTACSLVSCTCVNMNSQTRSHPLHPLHEPACASDIARAMAFIKFTSTSGYYYWSHQGSWPVLGGKGIDQFGGRKVWSVHILMHKRLMMCLRAYTIFPRIVATFFSAQHTCNIYSRTTTTLLGPAWCACKCTQ